MKTNPDLLKILKDKELLTKVYLFFSSKTAGDDFDPYEKNYINSNLNPLVIKAYVREITPEALVWKQYGLHQMGAKEILCEEKYRNWFEKCNKIQIDNITYQVFKEGTGNRTLIAKRPMKMIRVVVSRLN